MATYVHDEIVPDKKSTLGKKNQVAAMFNAIAGRYDFLNHFLSAGIDRGWRKKTLRELKNVNPKMILDVATGTGDVAILACKILNPEKIIGIDISDGMLELGRKKIATLNLTPVIKLLNGDSEKMNFDSDSFDAVTIAFGVRNFEHLDKGLAEIFRVLKPGGKISILEFSKPKTYLFKGFYNLYMKIIAPGLGKLLAKNKEAYEYLNDSVQAFPDREVFLEIMQRAGFKQTYFKQLTFGICCIYCGNK